MRTWGVESRTRPVILLLLIRGSIPLARNIPFGRGTDRLRSEKIVACFLFAEIAGNSPRYPQL